MQAASDVSNFEVKSTPPNVGPVVAVGSVGLSACASMARAANPISDAEAARFLAQASLGASRELIKEVQTLGYSGWIDRQSTLNGNGTRWSWLVAKGFNASNYRTGVAGFDACMWRKLISSPDTFRQRVALTWSEILVVGIDGLVGGGWRTFAAANYMDLLEQYGLSTFRELLEKVTTSTAMGMYLTYRGNTKFNAKTGAMPDENYAREIMQLFSIGLVMLNQDGTPQLKNGQPIESYTQSDITGLARVWTGWGFDVVGGNTTTPDFHQRPMVQTPSRHESGASTFLGQTIPAGLSGENAMMKALDVICAHPNVAPFISKQLIQKLVSSNPSPAYVARVAKVFNNDGNGQKGNLKAVFKAILLDDEARVFNSAAAPQGGKLREPMLRFLSWARAFKVNSASDAWAMPDTTDPATRLGQAPLRSPSVFNYFRPGYIPPNTQMSANGLVAPEFQLVNESSVIGYLNFMQRAVSTGIGDVQADYQSLISLADNAGQLIDELNLVMCANQLSGNTVNLLRSAVGSMPSGDDAKRKNRVAAGLLLVLASPEYLIQK